MSWNSSLPADTTKVREGPLYIRNNFQAIQEAPSSFSQYCANLISRSTVGPIPNTPATIADVMEVYSRDGDVSGDPELYAQNDSTGEVQLTSGGRMGSQSTSVDAAALYMAGGTIGYTGNNFVTAWALVTPSAAPTPPTITYGSNIASATNSSTGVYTVVTSNVFTNANIAAFVMPVNSTQYFGYYGGVSGTTQLTLTITTARLGGTFPALQTPVNTPFCVAILGGI